MKDIWDKMKQEIDKRYKKIGQHTEWSPFVTGNNVVAAVEDSNGNIWTGINIETASGVVCVCAERVALLKMVTESDTVVAKRVLAYGQQLPKKELNNWSPCGACREFLMQLSDRNKDCEILMDSRETTKLEELMPHWWGQSRFKNQENAQEIE